MGHEGLGWGVGGLNTKDGMTDHRPTDIRNSVTPNLKIPEHTVSQTRQTTV